MTNHLSESSSSYARECQRWDSQFVSAGVQSLDCRRLGLESSLHLQKRSGSEFAKKQQIDTGFKKAIKTIESA